MSKLVPHLHCSFGTYAVLGNHDFIEMVPPMEDMGIKFLLNEAQEINVGADSIWLLGVDDAHFYGVDNLIDTLRNVPTEATKILLCHTPELYKKAAKHPIDVFLAGHTHGGQICLLGRKPIITDASCPRSIVSGQWTYKILQGYTSNGTGSSGVPVRFFCPPEIVIHTLEPLL